MSEILSSQIGLGISFVVSLLPFSFRHHLLYFGFPNWCPESVDLIFNSDVFCLFPTGYVTLPTAAPCRGCLIPSEFYGTVILSSYFFIMASWPSFLHLARKKASMRPQNYHSTLPGSQHSAASLLFCGSITTWAWQNLTAPCAIQSEFYLSFRRHHYRCQPQVYWCLFYDIRLQC